MGMPAPKIFKTFNRRLRKETAHIDGKPVKFYRKGRKWYWRVVGASVKVNREQT